MGQFNVGSLPSKAAAEKKDYSFVWKAEMEKDGDSISASAWAIGVGVTINTTDKPATFDSQTTTVWLDPASTPSATPYILKNTITTTRGRVHVATALLLVVA